MPQKPPSLVDVEENKISKILENLKETISGAHLTRYAGYIEEMLEDTSIRNEQDNYITTLDVAAAFLKLATGQSSNRISSDSDDEDYDDVVTGNGMVRLFLNAGTMDKIQPRDIIDSIASTTSLPSRLIGAINIFDRYTFLEVPREYATEVLMSMKNTKIKGRRINVEKANKR